ncbi:threonine synthase [Patescibacteria group bacterium]|nr:threonine synthase [Patescibacteria group bacterium]
MKNYENKMSFSCSNCNRNYSIETRDFRCQCGGAFKLNWAAKPISLSSLKDRGTSIWRYRESLPIVEDRNIVSLGEGFTPLIPFLYKDFKKVLLKLDYLCPTGSFKDRGTTVLISKLKELDIKSCIADSSGNAGSSIAAYAAKAGIECKIYCPAHASEGKLVQIKAYGAQLVKVPGTRADTAVAVQEEAKKIYYASQNWHPFFLEGIKTLAFEICEQLGWKVPDAVLCPTGYSSIYIGLYYGFKELIDQGITNKIPKLIGVQSEAISPLYQAFSRKAKEVVEVPSKTTLAEGIACVNPIRGREILEIAQSTQGCFEIVSEKEIMDGWKELARQGIYVEPTSAVVIKAIDRLADRGLLNRGDHIVPILTGIGLKATETLGKYVDTKN